MGFLNKKNLTNKATLNSVGPILPYNDEIHSYLNPNVMTDENMMEENMKVLIEINKQRNESDNISVVTVRTF